MPTIRYPVARALRTGALAAAFLSARPLDAQTAPFTAADYDRAVRMLGPNRRAWCAAAVCRATWLPRRPLLVPHRDG